MLRFKILQFKERHLAIGQHFTQSLRGSWGSSNLSFMSLGHTNVEICNMGEIAWEELKKLGLQH